MCRLICAFVFRICHKACFLMEWLKYNIEQLLLAGLVKVSISTNMKKNVFHTMYLKKKSLFLNFHYLQNIANVMPYLKFCLCILLITKFQKSFCGIKWMFFGFVFHDLNVVLPGNYTYLFPNFSLFIKQCLVLGFCLSKSLKSLICLYMFHCLSSAHEVL